MSERLITKAEAQDALDLIFRDYDSVILETKRRLPSRRFSSYMDLYAKEIKDIESENTTSFTLGEGSGFRVAKYRKAIDKMEDKHSEHEIDEDEAFNTPSSESEKIPHLISETHTALKNCINIAFRKTEAIEESQFIKIFHELYELVHDELKVSSVASKIVLERLFKNLELDIHKESPQR